MNTDIDFKVLNDIINEYEYSKDKNIDQLCKHTNTILDGYTTLCTDCGEELEKNNIHDKEWKHYSNHNVDPNRCQLRKNSERTIFEDVKGMGFSENIVCIANQIYIDITRGNIKRGSIRKSIIFACVYQAYNITGTTPNFKNFVAQFNLRKKTAMKGVKYVSIKTPKKYYKNFSYTTPINYINEIMTIFNASPIQIKDTCDIYNKVKNKSSILNGSRAQSISAGIVYYWIVNNNVNIDIKTFAKRVELSELTIKKIYKEIMKIEKEERNQEKE